MTSVPPTQPPAAPETDVRAGEPNIVQRIVNAWDCCGTCAGGVLARHVADREAAARAEAWDEGYDARAGYMELRNEARREDNPYREAR